MKTTVKDFTINNTLDIELIINTYNNYIYKIIKNGISNEDVIEELLSDVFIIIWKNQEKLDPNMEVKPYLIGITRNLIKKKYKELSIKLDDFEKFENVVGINTYTILDNKEQSRIILNVLNNSKSIEKEMFMLFYYNGKKVKEISEMLNVSQSNVKITLYRLRKKIKHDLMKEGYNHG